MSNATDMSNGAGSTDELIEFLSLRMFPEKLTISAQSDVVAGARKAEFDAYLEGVAEYEDELRSLSPEALMQLIEDEQQRDAEAEQEEAERLENERFFNKPTARAYYRSWVERNYWTLDEATALILGKDPKVVNWDSIDPLVHKSPFARRYETLRRQFLRARFDGMLYEPLVPADFLRYAKSVGFALPVELDRLLRSDDEEQERQKRQVMDSLKLAELKKAIELAAEPPAPDPVEEPEVDDEAEQSADDAESNPDLADPDIADPQDPALLEEAAGEDAPSEKEADGEDVLIAEEADDETVTTEEDEAQNGEDQDAEMVSEALSDLPEETSSEIVEDDNDDVDTSDGDASGGAEERPDEDTELAALDAGDSGDDVDAADVDVSSTDELVDEETIGEAEPTVEVKSLDETEPVNAPHMNGESVEIANLDSPDKAAVEDQEEWYFPDERPETDYKEERQALLNIFVAMAVGRYGHEPGLMRRSTIADIVRDHEKIGLACDEDAIRDFLREASGDETADPY